MSASGGQPSSTIRGIAETIVVLPYQLGYRPERSLVVICLDHSPGRAHRSTGTVTLTARADLDPPGGEPIVLSAVTEALERVSPQVVLLIAFEGADDDATSLLARASDLAAQRGAVVDRAVRVRDGRWIPREEPDGSDPVWRALPADADVPAVADYVLRGRSPLADRTQLGRLLVTGRPLLTRAVGDELARRMRSANGPGDLHGDDENALSVISDVLDTSGPELPEIGVDALADLVVATHDVQLRDAVLARLSPGVMRLSDAPPDVAALVVRTLPVLHDTDGSSCLRMARLAALAPTPFAAPLLTMCAYLSWCAGEGTMANLALDRALGADPSYSLALLLEHALRHAMPPPGRRRVTARGEGSPAA